MLTKYRGILFSKDNTYAWKSYILKLPIAERHERTDLDLIHRYEREIHSMFGDLFNPEIYILKAVLHERLKEYDHALELYDQATKRFPTFARAYLYKAQLLQDLDRDKESSTVLDSLMSNKGYKKFTEGEQTDYKRLTDHVFASLRKLQN